MSGTKGGRNGFFVHKSIQAFAETIVQRHGSPSEQAFLFPSHAIADCCLQFFRAQQSFSDDRKTLRIVDLYPNDEEKPIISAVLFQSTHAKAAKAFWQHSGGGISSRRAEYCHEAFKDGRLGVKIPIIGVGKPRKPASVLYKGPKRYQKRQSTDEQSPRAGPFDGRDYLQFVEERFGRNLDISMADQAKLAIRKRIAGALTADVNLQETLRPTHSPTPTAHVEVFSEDDIYLYPCDNLETRCQDGERFLALFCEFPGNPLLKTPDLRRIRSLADRYDFAVVVDETISNFINVHVLPFADVVVSSLTKVFTGECNVMGGSRYYKRLKEAIKAEYEDNYWPEDAVFMERNSRDFVSRIHRINENAVAICDTLRASRIVKDVYYPKYSPTRANYDYFRTENGGYGGLLSVTFKSTAQAIAFFDQLDTAKGPSLGTNFTLCSPYVILAHYEELDWTAQFGVEADLVRLSVGLEDTNELTTKVRKALQAAEVAGRS
ncbi:MAG: hypothetical protein Q9217_001896 [Psora testacea]